jgi:hypothetical protein
VGKGVTVKTSPLIFSLILSTGVGFAPSWALAADLTLDQAAERALREVPGGTVEGVERDFEFGRRVIEVEVQGSDGLEHELVFDVSDGRLLAHRIDD